MRRFSLGNREPAIWKTRLLCRDAAEAERLLRELALDWDSRDYLRRWSSENTFRRPARSRSDREMLQRTASVLANGEIDITSVRRPYGSGGTPSGSSHFKKPSRSSVEVEIAAPKPDAGPAVTPAMLRGRETYPSLGPQSNSSRSAPMDEKAQIDALLNAARQGASFCEQCELAPSE